MTLVRLLLALLRLSSALCLGPLWPSASGFRGSRESSVWEKLEFRLILTANFYHRQDFWRR